VYIYYRAGRYHYRPYLIAINRERETTVQVFDSVHLCATAGISLAE